MAIKVRAIERNVSFDKQSEKWMYVMQPELYNRLSQAKVVEEASVRSGIPKGSLNASWEAIGDVIKAWATEGHSVAVPGLGTMRFSLRSKSQVDVNKVKSNLITSRRVLFTPNTDIKQVLASTGVAITCIDRFGNVVKRVNSSDEGDVEDTEFDYRVSLTASPVEGGTVTGAGTYQNGDSVTIEAVAASGYHFTQWSDGDMNAERTFSITEDVTLTATFEADSTSGGGSDTDSGGGTDPETPPFS